MTNEFSITTATNTILLDINRQGSATITANNLSGRELRGRASLETVPSNQPFASWLQIEGESERTFAIGATSQFVVKVNVPASANAGNYTFRLNLVDTANPDEGFNPGQSIVILVPQPEKPKPKFPLWLLPIILLVVAAIIVGIVFATRSKTITVPDVLGMTATDAQDALEEIGLRQRQGGNEFSETIDIGLVARTNPPAGTEVEPDSRVEWFISDGPAPVPPTSTPTPLPPTPTFTPLPPDTPTPDPGAWGGRWQITCDVMACDFLDAIQQGNQVTGTFAGGNGSIAGTVAGNRLSGIVTYLGATANFDFWLNADGTTWSGNWNQAINWCGYREGQSQPSPCGIASWYGNWNTFHFIGEQMILFQDGTRVFGTYAGTEGKIEATANNTTLSGSWTRGDTTGNMQFFLMNDGTQFNGNWNNNQQWCGTRSGSNFPNPCLRETFLVVVTVPFIDFTEFLEIDTLPREFFFLPTSTPSR